MAINQIPTDPQADSYVTVTEADNFISDRPNSSDWTNLSNSEKEARLKMATKHVDTFRFFSWPVFWDAMHYRKQQNLKFPRLISSGYRGANTTSGAADSGGNDTLTDSDLADLEYMPTDYWADGAIILTEGTGKGQTREIKSFDDSNGKIMTKTTWSTNPDSTSQYMLVFEVPEDIKNATIEQAFFIARGGYQTVLNQIQGLKDYKIGDLSESYGGGSAVFTPAGTPFSTEASAFLDGYVTRLGVLR